MSKLRIVFMGTPDFAVPALDALRRSGHEIVCVYSQPPRPKGRGHQVHPSPVHAYAEENHIPVRTPRSIRKLDAIQEFIALQADVAIVAAYGLILPKEILEAPKYGCINIHASLLPRWRGASPIQHAIWMGDKQTGVTLMQMDEGLDTGAMIDKQPVAIKPETTASSLHDELSSLGSAMIIEAVTKLARDGEIPATPQDNTVATYAKLLRKEDGFVDWNKTSVEIERQIRSLNPWPGVSTQANGQRFKILAAVNHSGALVDGDVGTILNRDGDIACGNGTILKLEKIQPPNAKPMDFASALNGGYFKVGGVLQ